MQRILRWGSSIFIAATLALLVWAKTEARVVRPLPEWPVYVLLATSVITLPIAITRVLRESDAASRRNWALFLGFCIVLAGGVLFFWK